MTQGPLFSTYCAFFAQGHGFASGCGLGGSPLGASVSPWDAAGQNFREGAEGGGTVSGQVSGLPPSKSPDIDFGSLSLAAQEAIVTGVMLRDGVAPPILAEDVVKEIQAWAGIPVTGEQGVSRG